VVRQLPILTPASADAAKMALAAAEQGKYPAFHRAMFAAGRPDGQSIAAAARAAGLDWPRAQAYAATPGVAAEIARNQQMAQQLGMNGTPSWVVGGQLLGGALGREALENALAAM
ncbi:MAG TPA: DsbA family protein, partial [Novosphingobium sp.]|nr:DsbA family protein [Novosphingobium sp.]